MSSEHALHITRANYEEYFLLYVDNELSAGDRAAVEAFADLHPDLQEELALLLDTKLEPAFLPLADKEALLAPGIAAAALEEDLLCYIDGELPEAERLHLEALLRTDAGLRAGHSALLQARLDPADVLPCPFKNELYREEPVRRRAFGWWRVAAAVLLIAGAGRAYLSPDENEGSTPGTLAHSGSTTGSTAAHVPAAITPSVPSQATVAYPGEAPDPKDVVTTKASPATKTPATHAGDPAAATIARSDRPEGRDRDASENSTVATTPFNDPAAATNEAQGSSYAQATLPERLSSLDAQPVSQQNINSAPVTDARHVAYTVQNNADSEASTASLNTGRQGSVRGFLRKATRFIERRTGIKTTNDDDQLLLGAVAISLK